MISASIAGDEIVFEVIEYCDNYLEREQYWIDFYKQQDSYSIVNQFDADRNGSSVTDAFRGTMSKVLQERWQDENYRSTTIERLKPTMFTSERLSKPVHVFLQSSGDFINTYKSAKDAAYHLGGSPTSTAAAARGAYRNTFIYQHGIYIYNAVLYKLDELLETHPELRVISSQAWEACKKYQEGSETNG